MNTAMNASPLRLPHDMADCTIVSSQCAGVQGLHSDGGSTAINMSPAYAASGFVPETAMASACGVAGISEHVVSHGIAALKLVAGTEHPAVAIGRGAGIAAPATHAEEIHSQALPGMGHDPAGRGTPS